MSAARGARAAARVAKPSATQARGAGPSAAGGELYELRLYIVSGTPRSDAALGNLTRLCELHLPGRHRIEVVDLRADPGRARDDQILALPTLIRRLPGPVRRLIGDLSDEQRVLGGLDLGAGPRAPR